MEAQDFELLKQNEAVLYKEYLTYMLTDKSYTCKCYHLGGTCRERLLYKAIGCFKGLLKINLPIHILPAVLFKLKIMSQKYRIILIYASGKLAFNILRSVMFLYSFVMTIIIMHCYGNCIFPKAHMGTINKISVLISGLGIVFEQPHKRVEITYYCLPRAIEGLWNIFEKRGYVKTVKFQDVRKNIYVFVTYMRLQAIVFAVAIGILAACFNDGNDVRTLKGFSRKTCKYLWDDQSSKNQQ